MVLWGLGALAIKKIKELASRIVKQFDVRARGISSTAATPVRWKPAEADPRERARGRPTLLIAHQPTRGLDVGAIEFVWKQILEQKESRSCRACSISAELDEIYRALGSDRHHLRGSDHRRVLSAYPGEEIGIGMTGGTKAEQREPSRSGH